MPRGDDTSRHDSRKVGRVNLTPPHGYGDYSNPETRDAQRRTDREFDRQEWEANNPR